MASVSRNLMDVATNSLETAKGAIFKPPEGPKGSKKPLEVHLKRLEAKRISLEAMSSVNEAPLRLRLQDMHFDDFKEAMSFPRLVRLVLEQIIFGSLEVGGASPERHRCM